MYYKKFAISLLLTVWMGFSCPHGYTYDHEFTNCQVMAAYSNKDDIQAMILEELNKARETVHLSLYGITNRTLANKLIQLHYKGVDIRVCVDKVQAAGPKSLTHLLSQNGIEVFVKKGNTLEHNNYAIVDGQVLVMGSWQWAEASNAQDNSEVVLQGCPSILDEFERGWEMLHQRDNPKWPSYNP